MQNDGDSVFKVSNMFKIENSNNDDDHVFKGIKNLETELIGSREFKVKNEQDEWNSTLIENSRNLPKNVHLFCKNLFEKLTSNDGFRKRAVPSLLYRYFFQMKNMFENF